MEKQNETQAATVDTDYPLLSKFFIEFLISKNEVFKNKFQADFPDLFADIESFYGNSNCSCGGKIEKYILSNKEKSVSFLDNFFEENESSREGFLKILQKVEEKYHYKEFLEEQELHKQRELDKENLGVNITADFPEDFQQTKDSVEEAYIQENDVINFSGKTELVKISEWENYIIGLREKQAKFFQFSTIKVDEETVRVFFL